MKDDGSNKADDQSILPHNKKHKRSAEMRAPKSIYNEYKLSLK